MDPLSDISLELARWLQDNFPQLESLFRILSELGRSELYLVAVTFIYWNVNKQLGITLGFLYTFSNSLQESLKHLFRDPRPLWLDSSIGLSEESNYGLPSGHTQSATVFYFALASWFRKSWIWFAAALISVLMALSRIYLGVHDIQDVVLGFLLGMFIIAGFWLWRSFGAGRVGKRILGQRLIIGVTLPGILIVAYIITRFLAGPADETVSWSAYVVAAETEGYKNVTMAIGGFLGFTIGFILEGSWVRSKVAGPAWKKITRYVIGVTVVLLLWFIPRNLIPDDPLWLMIPLRAIQVLILSLWITYYAPWLFVKIKLADSDPEPEIDISL